MRARPHLPGIAAGAALLALTGCGSGNDPVTTVTVTRPPDGTTAARRPDRPDATTTGRAPATTRTTRARPRTAARTTTVTRPPGARTATSAPPRRSTTVLGSGSGGPTAAGLRAAGTDFTAVTPQGWSDGTARLAGGDIDADLALVKGRGDGVVTNILVVRTVRRSSSDRTLPALAAALRRKLITDTGGIEPSRAPGIDVDGERAVVFAVRRTVGRTDLVQRQVAVVRGTAVHTIALTAPRGTADADLETFARFLRSWRWD